VIELSAYLRLNLTSKEIAPLLNISYRGVEPGDTGSGEGWCWKAMRISLNSFLNSDFLYQTVVSVPASRQTLPFLKRMTLV